VSGASVQRGRAHHRARCISLDIMGSAQMQAQSACIGDLWGFSAADFVFLSVGRARPPKGKLRIIYNVKIFGRLSQDPARQACLDGRRRSGEGRNVVG